jgi:hypothetical protein
MAIYTINAPRHRPTALHIQCRRDYTQRYYLHAWTRTGKLLYTQNYGPHLWRGHCNGHLLIDAFLTQAEAVAARESVQL